MSKIRFINASLCKTDEIDLVSSYLTVPRTFWKKEWVGGRCRRVPQAYDGHLVTKKGVFLAGWSIRVAKFLKKEGYAVKWQNEQIPDIAIKEQLKFDNVELKNYQQDFVNVCLKQGRGIITSATGSGKTVMEGAILASYPKAKRLILCHSKKLLHQLADKLESQYGLYVTKVGDGKSNITGDVIVAIINSWALQPLEVLESIDVVLVDECFSKGTLIATPKGVSCIEKLNIGDIVITPYGNKKITYVFKTKVPLNRIIKLSLSNKEEIVCSAEHLFYTKKGWVKAKELKNCALTSLYAHDLGETDEIFEKEKNLCDVQKNNNAYSQILFSPLYVYKRRTQKNLFRDNGKNKQKIRFRKNEITQPLPQSSNNRERENNEKNKRNTSHMAGKTRREWTTNYSANLISRIFRLANRSICTYWRRALQWLSHELQNRYRKQKIKNWYRNRWKRTQRGKAEKERPQKRKEIKRIRVENIEIYKHGSNDESFKNIISDRERNQSYIEFYDLEIEDSHCYYANNVLVHNCHHVNSDDSLYFETLLKMTNAWRRFGFTATLPATKEGKLICEGTFGPILGKLSIETATELGMFAKVKVVLLDAPIVITESSKYADLYKKRIIYNKERNKLLVEEVIKVNSAGESCLIYIKEINHGKKLKRMIPGSVFVSGRVSGAEQSIISDKLDKKEIMNVIATTTWKEGVDIPSLNNVFNGAGGKSEIAVVQNVGRGARTTKDKTEIKIFDFIDHGKFLEGHTCDRLSIYIKNKWL